MHCSLGLGITSLAKKRRSCMMSLGLMGGGGLHCWTVQVPLCWFHNYLQWETLNPCLLRHGKAPYISIGNECASRGCLQSNLFRQGSVGVRVFRYWTSREWSLIISFQAKVTVVGKTCSVTWCRIESMTPGSSCMIQVCTCTWVDPYINSNTLFQVRRT